jgi:hypothetical protein
VQSLVSCVHSRVGVHIEPNAESVPIASLIRVHLFAKDVDDLPISITRAEIGLIFGDKTIPMEWSRGSNQYVADVPAELIAQPGRYDLVVRAKDAWNETGLAPSCELLRRTIIVREGLSTTWILVGAATAAVVVLGGLILVVRKRNAHLQAIFVMLFTEVRANPVPLETPFPFSASLWLNTDPLQMPPPLLGADCHADRKCGLLIGERACRLGLSRTCRSYNRCDNLRSAEVRRRCSPQ